MTREEEILRRVTMTFTCRSVVLATERQKADNAQHYHVGIWALDASKKTLRKNLRKNFPEWEGRAIDVSVHKGWATIFAYILKEDSQPLVWGQFSLTQIQRIAGAQAQKKERQRSITQTYSTDWKIYKQDWYQIYRDEILQTKVLLTALPRMKEAFEDLRVLRDIESTPLERILDYLANKGWPRAGKVEFLTPRLTVVIPFYGSQLDSFNRSKI